MNNKYKIPQTKEEWGKLKIQDFSNYHKMEKDYRMKLLFYEVVHNIASTIYFIVCIPIFPIIAIIETIKED
jgi:hypothetical protein